VRTAFARGASATIIAKQMTGHKSDSMFSRYGLVGEAELLRAAQEKVAQFRKRAAR